MEAYFTSRYSVRFTKETRHCTFFVLEGLIGVIYGAPGWCSYCEWIIGDIEELS
jgi:hypothetical protein